MEIHKLSELNDLKGKKVLLRVDFNVPTDKSGEIQDDTRMRESLDTIRHLQEKSAKIIILSHLGRPDGEVKEELRLNKVGEHLAKLLNKPVKKLDDCIGVEVKKATAEMAEGEIILLENVRFHKEEEECEENFTKELASLGEIFVNDAFGTAHRKHASTAGLADYLPAYAGILMEREITALSPLVEGKIEKPLTMIFGGAKIDTKIGIIKHFLDKADYFLMGGALANTFLHAAEFNVGKSLYEADKTDVAKEIMNKCPKENFLLPEDVVIANEISETAKTTEISIENSNEESKILDIGEKTAKNFCGIIAKSKTIIWNGPLGLCEFKPFQKGTKIVGEFIAAQKHLTSIVGGGDTADALKRLDINENAFTHVSTGGGACIEFLSGEKLPGIEVLRKN